MSLATYFAPDDAEMGEHYNSRREHLADLIVHAVGIAGALVGGGALFGLQVAQRGGSLTIAVGVYAAGLLTMLACSAVYNLTRPSRARRVLRRLDEAAIFVMIAGSYTPFLLRLVPSPWDGAALTLVWSLAIGGVVGKLFFVGLSDRFWYLAYVAFGWLAVFLLGPFVTNLPLAAGILLAAGGLIYSLGVLIFVRDGLPYRRAIWHGFVVAGAAMHGFAVAAAVAAT